MADRQLIRPLDVPALRAQYARAEPFPYFVIEGQAPGGGASLQAAP